MLNITTITQDDLESVKDLIFNLRGVKFMLKQFRNYLATKAKVYSNDMTVCIGDMP